jgi:ABC-type nickel/cobalt efflux system permease component RcnA
VRRVFVVVIGFLALAAPSVANAHPLGNFTINRFSRIETSGHRIYVRYVLDLAEIPTFEARRDGVDAGVYSRRIARNVVLRVDGRRATLIPLRHELAFPIGAAGLHTMRLEVILLGPRIAAPAQVDYADRNYGDRIGWKEIVVGDAPSRSHELRAYPKDLLQSPLEVTHVSTQLEPTDGPDVAPRLSSGRSLQAPDRVADAGFASLIRRGDLSTGVVLLSLVLALFWGAAHALSPGHGKAIVAAYLVGTRGSARHAALLGLVVTITHTIGVFALGLVTLALSQFVVPSSLYPWLNLASALLVVSVGLAVLRTRVAHARAPHGHRHDHHHHAHGHWHSHDPALSLRRLLGVGISGGIIPCPTALVVLLAAISLHRIGYGLLLIVAFSVGLAAAVTGIGLVAVTAKSLFSRSSFEGRVVRVLPTVSALVVLALGVAMTARALPGVA